MDGKPPWNSRESAGPDDKGHSSKRLLREWVKLTQSRSEPNCTCTLAPSAEASAPIPTGNITFNPTHLMGTTTAPRPCILGRPDVQKLERQRSLRRESSLANTIDANAFIEIFRTKPRELLARHALRYEANPANNLATFGEILICQISHSPGPIRSRVS